MSQKYTGEAATLDVLRDGAAQQLDITLSRPSALVPLHLNDADPSYVVIAGALRECHQHASRHPWQAMPITPTCSMTTASLSEAYQHDPGMRCFNKQLPMQCYFARQQSPEDDHAAPLLLSSHMFALQVCGQRAKLSIPSALSAENGNRILAMTVCMGLRMVWHTAGRLFFGTWQAAAMPLAYSRQLQVNWCTASMYMS